jgi:hypothetical protein
MRGKIPEKSYVVKAMKYKRNGHLIKLLGDQILFKGQYLNLSHRPRILELVRVFFKTPNKPKSIQDILKEICQQPKLQDFSERYRRSARAQVLKNLQRCRALFNQAFSNIDDKNKWIFHDRRSKKWTFYGVCRKRLRKKMMPVLVPQLQ